MQKKKDSKRQRHILDTGLKETKGGTENKQVICFLQTLLQESAKEKKGPLS